MLACYVLAAWHLLGWQWGALGEDYLPMAPSTAWMALLLSAGLIASCRWPGPGAVQLSARAAMGLVGALSLLGLSPGGLGLMPGLEDWLTPPVVADLGVPAGRISPLTAAAFLVLSTATALTRGGGRGRGRQAGALAATLALVGGAGIIFGYAAGAPPFYNQAMIPMALLTAVVIVLLSAALLALAGPRTWPLSVFAAMASPALSSAQPARFMRRTPLTAFAFLLAAILAIGLALLRNQVNTAREAAEEGLTTVADLKAEQIANWHRRQVDLISIVQQTSLPRKLLQGVLSGVANEEARQDLLGMMAAWREINGYLRVSVYDARGVRRLTVPPAESEGSPLPPDVLRQALASREVHVQDLHRDSPASGGDTGQVHLTLLAPVAHPNGAGHPPLGLISADSDAERFLFPLVQSWPTDSHTAETLLVRREGDEVVFLNDLRYRASAALTLRLPLGSSRRLPAALAVTGSRGPMLGLDYRGVFVLAAARPVQGTPWHMVAKIDQEEILAPLRDRAFMVTALIVLVVFVAGLGVKLVWRRRETDWFQEQLEMERARQALAQRVRYLNRFANDVILMLDQQGRILEANQRAEEAYGYDRDALAGLSFTHLLPPVEHDLEDAPRIAPDNRGGLMYEDLHRRRDGSLFPVEVSSRSVEIDGTEYILAIIRDISERKRAEAALRESQARSALLSDLLNRSSQPFGVGLPDGRLDFCNQAFLDLVGYTQDELARMDWSRDLTPAHWREIEAQKLDELLRTGHPVRYEKEYRRKDGSLVPVELLVHLMRGEDGQPSYYYSFGTDISERKRAEEEKLKLEAQVRQSQKMEAVGTLAGGIAHDFNNLLAIIMGFAEISLEKTEQQGAETSDIQEVIQAAQRARKLVRQIMAFSRSQKMEARPLDLNEIVRGTSNLLGRTLMKNINLDLRLDPDLAPILGDPNELEQILLNLATNAQDAMPQGGGLLIRTRNMDMDPEFVRLHPGLAPGPHVLLQLTDTGTGMDARTRERVFDPFFTTKEAGKGTGLGLSTVYGIVRNHNGDMTCYSEQGKGTTFNIYLPAHLPGEGAATEDASAPPRELGGAETILLVDDEDALLKMGAALLASMGYRVVSAASGEEALEFYRRRREELDLVVLDLGMPGMGGERCLREILAWDPQAKVVVASGYAFEHTVKNALDAGAKGFVAKPFTKGDLLGMVRAVLDQEGRQPPPV